MNNNMEKEIFEVYVDDIIPNRFQPRLTFDDSSLKELAESIKQHGIIQPLVVRKVGDKYEIIAGERRYKAAQMVGLQKVPTIIMNLNDEESAEVAVVENIQRKNLTALEEAESYKKLLDKGFLTQEQLASRMGKAQATISNKMRLLGLDEKVKDALLNEKISERHARSLLSLKTSEGQQEVLQKIIDNKLTVRQTDDLIKTMLGGDVIETIDFTENIPEKVATPAATIPDLKNEDINNSIMEVNVEKIKDSAVDINPMVEMADIEALLGTKPLAPITPMMASEPEEKVPRFISTLEEEVSEEPFVSPLTTISVPEVQAETPVPTIESHFFESEPKTFTDSLVQEFRQANTVDAPAIIEGDLSSAIAGINNIIEELKKAKFKVEIEDFDFEHLYQAIIKIEK